MNLTWNYSSPPKKYDYNVKYQKRFNKILRQAHELLKYENSTI